MKSINSINQFLACTLVLLFVSCSQEAVVDDSEEQNLSAIEQKLAKIPRSTHTFINSRAPVVYAPELCGDIVVATHDGGISSIFDAALFDYYFFNGTAGDVITITVPRTTEFMDPGFSLYEGTTASTDMVSVFDGGPDMTFLAFADDGVVNPIALCFEDPELVSFVLPNTATYTLAVFDVSGCGSPMEYEIQTMGIDCNADPDADGDGCFDDVDPHPNSNTDPTVVIDGCDTNVNNLFVDDCSTMADLLGDCAAGASNHLQYVRCVVRLTREWRNTGLINFWERRRIIRCAVRSGIPNS